MNGIAFEAPIERNGFTVVKTVAADGYKKIIHFETDEELVYEGVRYSVIKKWKTGNVKLKRLSDGVTVKMTPFTYIKL